MERDKFMAAEEAMEFGIIDEILVHRPPSDEEQQEEQEKKGSSDSSDAPD